MSDRKFKQVSGKVKGKATYELELYLDKPNHLALNIKLKNDFKTIFENIENKREYDALFGKFKRLINFAFKQHISNVVSIYGINYPEINTNGSSSSYTDLFWLFENKDDSWKEHYIQDIEAIIETAWEVIEYHYKENL